MTTDARWPVERALISVSNKDGVVDFARALAGRGIEILSTGGTAKLLASSGVKVTEVSDYTGFPEMMDGRVKTLHPKIHGGLLGRRGVDDAIMRAHAIEPIGLVVVNLYPFEETVAKPGCDLPMAIENIDVGGPTMLRAAAKNHASCAVVCDPADYARVLNALNTQDGCVTAELRFDLAVKAFEHTARYDGAIANYLGALGGAGGAPGFPRSLSLQLRKVQDLRYGENPHQSAAFYREHKQFPGTVAGATLRQGKPLSFNNIADADAAWQCVKQFEEPACVIVKHGNPCGVALGTGLMQAYDLAYACDSTSAFGGVIAFNRELDSTTLKAIIDRQFVEVIIAPSMQADAVTAAARKPDVRLLECGKAREQDAGVMDYRRVEGGLLVQQADEDLVADAGLKTVTKRQPDAREVDDLAFAWRVAKFVKSNAIVYVKDRRTIGVGAGQMSRVDSARIAARKAADAGLDIKGAVMASDAFFPFRDGIDTAHEAGIRAVIQPGGSLRDAEVIAAADEHGMAMVLTGMRHFRH